MMREDINPSVADDPAPWSLASTASAGRRVKISILLRRNGRIAGKLVPPRGDDLTLAGTNDGISRFDMMHFCGVGRSAEGDQEA